MIKRYKDFYGCTASIHFRSGSYVLRICNAYGHMIHRKTYDTMTGARIAMGKWSDCWKENK